jgi:hypothetical protein
MCECNAKLQPRCRVDKSQQRGHVNPVCVMLPVANDNGHLPCKIEEIVADYWQQYAGEKVAEVVHMYDHDRFGSFKRPILLADLTIDVSKENKVWLLSVVIHAMVVPPKVKASIGRRIEPVV